MALWVERGQRLWRLVELGNPEKAVEIGLRFIGAKAIDAATGALET